MPREYPRAWRVGEQIQRELSELIRSEVKDPRVGMVTVMGVDVSADLAHAKVYVSSLEPAHELDEAVAALNRAAGFLRGRLGRRLRIRTVPELRFLRDDSVERGVRLTHLIDEVVAKERGRGGPSDTEDG